YRPPANRHTRVRGISLAPFFCPRDRRSRPGAGSQVNCPPLMDASGNIFLVGPMGVGKSTVGRRLAEATGRHFLDADEEIERRTGVRIDVIFDIEGEAGFRLREARILDELTRLKGIVLATGGGAVLDPENRARLSSNGSVVYLSAPAAVLARRTERDRVRPLLQAPDRRQRIEELL